MQRVSRYVEPWGLGKVIAVLAIFYLVIAVAASVITGLIVKSGIDGTQAGQRRALVTACQRSQIQSAKDNKSQYADWTYDRVFLVLAQHSPAQPGQSPAQQRKLLAQFLTPLRGAIAAKAWVPIIGDCEREITTHGALFFPPQPIPFDKRLPPRSALKVPPPAVRIPR